MFISMLLGGTVYTGKNIHDAHAPSRHYGLSDAHFDLFLVQNPGFYLVDIKTGFETAVAVLPFTFANTLELVNPHEH
jgi:hypothetical protein